MSPPLGAAGKQDQLIIGQPVQRLKLFKAAKRQAFLAGHRHTPCRFKPENKLAIVLTIVNSDSENNHAPRV
jgi:hypothetical protein